MSVIYSYLLNTDCNLEYRLGNWVQGVGLGAVYYWVCGFESQRGIHITLLGVLCFHVQVAMTDWSLVQKSRNCWSVTENDQVACIYWRPWATVGSRTVKKHVTKHYFIQVNCVCIMALMWNFSVNFDVTDQRRSQTVHSSNCGETIMVGPGIELGKALNLISHSYLQYN